MIRLNSSKLIVTSYLSNSCGISQTIEKMYAKFTRKYIFLSIYFQGPKFYGTDLLRNQKSM